MGLQGVVVVWYSYTSKNSIVAGTLEWYLRTEVDYEVNWNEFWLCY